ncbi:hypothetical protein [Streptomyces sp. 8L]|uniref:hypothetical protein n=1 Tax=Streptomyces sp. 8L TaxID=2877242 RepID=UPI001CD6738D|nr:hypothetical protein [Streptomyces sp. 8L]MCA1223468.1 hypothetical protein [Streptomyces sp. 8L]
MDDICQSMPDQQKLGQDPGEWLAVAQKPTADEKEILRAGMPSLCPAWSKVALAAIGGDFTRTYGDGTYRVVSKPRGELEIAPGSYRTSGDLSGCYWERTTSSGHVIDNQYATSARSITVRVAASDGQFTSKGCGTWKPVR